VLLHGVGADGWDLIELASAMAAVLPGAAFVAPNAPEPCDMVGFGHQWFSLRDRRPDALLLGVQAVAPLVNAFLDAELERYRLGDHQLALLGFSQAR
jgi:phospholipase/carboxylesterase